MRVVSVVCSGTKSSSSLVVGGGGNVLTGDGYTLFSGLPLYNTCMYCGDLNSADKDFFKLT